MKKPFFPLWFSGAALPLGLLLIEPLLEGLTTIGDTLSAQQYIRVCPLGELTYVFPALRPIPLGIPALIAVFLFFIALVPLVETWQGTMRYRAGIILLAAGVLLLSLEQFLHARWTLGPVMVRYAFAMSAVAMGPVVALMSRSYLGSLGLVAFLWDISSAIFWSFVKGSVWTPLPVPYFGKYSGAVSGPPALVPIALDSIMIIFWIWFLSTRRRYIIRWRP